jgi:Lectin C-type domain
MMRDSRKLVRMQASLSLLWASVGCLSIDPISSYSAGRSEVGEVPAALEPESAAPVPDSSEVQEEAAPSDVLEGVPGEGDIALDPGVTQEEPPAPEPVSTCTGMGEFASSDGARCYLTSSQNAAWQDALESCESWGGSLVNIESREEDTFLGQRVQTSFWIAASDRVQEGRMLSSGGDPLAFFNWTAGQPDDFQGREDCVVKTTPAGTWNDRPCGNVIAYVCERSPD